VPATLITGASTGIGREFARVCAHDGRNIVLVARSRGPLESLADEIRSQSGRIAHVIVKDLSNPAAPQELFDQLISSAIEIDVLINNAGFGLVGRFWELGQAEQMEMLRLNIGALTDLSRLFLPGFIQRRRGGILNVASTAAFQPGPLMAVYYASKSYVVSLTKRATSELRSLAYVQVPREPSLIREPAPVQPNCSPAGAQWMPPRLRELVGMRSKPGNPSSSQVA
jgi:short-subunit dehydrogenase